MVGEKKRERTAGNARSGNRTEREGGREFVIKFKIPSAEEADERVTNGRDRNGSSTTSSRDVE